MPLLNDADKLYLGTVAVDKVYCGPQLVWPSKFDPSIIPNLTFWLDASQLTALPGADVTAWPDISGNNRVVNIVGTPTIRISPDLRNGNKVVRFSLNEGRVRALAIGADKDFTMVYVARMRNNAVQGRVVTTTYPPSNALFGWWGGFEDICYAGNFLLPDTRVSQTTNWKLYSADASTTPTYQPRMFSNGTFLTGDGTINTTDGLNNLLNLSGYDANLTPESCDCEVAEVIIYSRKLSDIERQQVEAYLRTKWGM